MPKVKWEAIPRCKCEDCLNLGWTPPFAHQVMEGDTQEPYCKAQRTIVESGDHYLDEEHNCEFFTQHIKFKSAFIFTSGMVMVFDDNGQQIPALQGEWEVMKEKIYANKTEFSQIYGEGYPLEWRKEYNGIR